MVINANSIAQSIYADLTLMDGIGPVLDAMDEQQTEVVLAGIENVMALAIAERIAGPAPAVDDAYASAKAIMDTMTDADRLDLIHEYCQGCGSKETSCCCMRDD
jgi:hypothetical protein